MNNLNAIIPKILSRGLLTLRGKLIMPRIVNGDYSSDAAQKGSVINVPIPTAAAVTDVTPSNTKPVLVDKTPSSVDIPLDQWKMSSFHLSDQDMLRIDMDAHFMPMSTLSAIDAIAENINGYIMGLYKQVPNWVGTAGTTPFATDAAAAIAARKKLSALKAPSAERRFVLDLDAEANALGLTQFADVSQVGERNVKIEGEIGRKYGFDFFSDQQVPYHTKGMAGTVLTNGIQAAGATSIVIDGITTAVVPGDLFTIAGQSTQYTVISVSALVSTEQTVVISPALSAQVADGIQLTPVASHAVNLAFHRDAFAFAMRPLAQSSQAMAMGSKIMSLTDPATGITMRLEVTRVHKAVTWEFDVLYGGKLVRPELAVRVLG